MLAGRTSRLAVAAAAALALADASIVTLALPRLLTELDASVEGVAAVLGVYTVVLALALIPANVLRRRLGARRLGSTGLGLFAAACAGCAAAPALDELLALRALQAIAAAAALVAAFELLGVADPRAPGRRLWTTAAVIGVAAGPALGGILTQTLDWRAIFIAQIPVAIAGAIASERGPTAAPRPTQSAGRGPRAANQPLPCRAHLWWRHSAACGRGSAATNSVRRDDRSVELGPAIASRSRRTRPHVDPQTRPRRDQA